MSNDWFDAEYYAEQKVLQMNAVNFRPGWLVARGAASWNIDLYYAYLAEWRGDDGRAGTALQDFLAANGRDYGPDTALDCINISGNPLFDVKTYAANVAAWANSYAPEAWTAESITAHILTEHQMSLWEHSKGPGLLNQINPSDEFDVSAYLQARAAKMNELAGRHDLTVQDAIAAIQARGRNVIMDYFDYGKKHGLTRPGCALLFTQFVQNNALASGNFAQNRTVKPAMALRDHPGPEPFYSQKISSPPIAAQQASDLDSEFVARAVSIAYANPEEDNSDFVAIVNLQDAPFNHDPLTNTVNLSPEDAGPDTDTACAYTDPSLMKPEYAELIRANMALPG